MGDLWQDESRIFGQALRFGLLVLAGAGVVLIGLVVAIVWVRK